MPLRYSVPAPNTPGGDPDFRAIRPILDDLKAACAKEPGVVLADNDAGHYIRYYTQCSVIANNFLLTRQQEEKIVLIDHLLEMSAEGMPKAAPYVRYVLLRPANVAGSKKTGYQYMPYSQGKGAALITDLLLRPSDEVSPRYLVLREAVMRTAEANENIPLMRLFKVLQPGEKPAPQVALDSGPTDKPRH